MKDFGAVCRDVRFREVGVSTMTFLHTFFFPTPGWGFPKGLTIYLPSTGIFLDHGLLIIQFFSSLSDP